MLVSARWLRISLLIKCVFTGFVDRARILTLSSVQLGLFFGSMGHQQFCRGYPSLNRKASWRSPPKKKSTTMISKRLNLAVYLVFMLGYLCDIFRLGSHTISSFNQWNSLDRKDFLSNLSSKILASRFSAFPLALCWSIWPVSPNVLNAPLRLPTPLQRLAGQHLSFLQLLSAVARRLRRSMLAIRGLQMFCCSSALLVPYIKITTFIFISHSLDYFPWRPYSTWAYRIILSHSKSDVLDKILKSILSADGDLYIPNSTASGRGTRVVMWILTNYE